MTGQSGCACVKSIKFDKQSFFATVSLFRTQIKSGLCFSWVNRIPALLPAAYPRFSSLPIKKSFIFAVPLLGSPGVFCWLCDSHQARRRARESSRELLSQMTMFMVPG